jgi:diguanylate cyclase (GGDEF)-like protein
MYPAAAVRLRFPKSRLRDRGATLDCYLILVSLIGVAVLSGVVVASKDRLINELSPQLAVFAGFILLCELLTIKVPRHEARINSSTPFMYAVLLTAGVAAAMICVAVAALISDHRERKSWIVPVFDLGRQTLAIGAGGLVLSSLSAAVPADASPLTAGQLPAILAAAATYFMISNTMAVAASALFTNSSIVSTLRSDFVFHALTTGVFLCLAPIIVVTADYDLTLLALFFLPLLAIYKGGRDAMANEHRALHDGLTNLPNRTCFANRVEQEIARTRRGSLVAVLLLDLDHFKEINDTLGHHHGDLLLQQVGPRLQAGLRTGDRVARMGGDEFAVLLPNIADVEDAQQLGDKLLEMLHEPFEVDGLTLDVSASVGVACWPEHGPDVETLLQRADVAMFLAKESRGGCEVYAPERDHYSPKRLILAGEMRRAIDADQFALFFQPVVEIEKDRIVGAEALARWIHPERGVVQPTEFIPIAEQTGLIRPLTIKLLDRALEQVLVWRDMGHELTVSVNISPRHLLDQQLPDDVVRLLEQHGASPRSLKFEITESTIMADPKRVEKVLSRLHAMGVKLAIDDFGTGYSSLSYLKRLPVSEVKIDRSFVMQMPTSVDDALIVRSTIELARNLALRVTAEGVETRGVWDELAGLGCHHAQGYYLSRPLPEEDFKRWIERYPGTCGAVDRSALTLGM